MTTQVAEPLQFQEAMEKAIQHFELLASTAEHFEELDDGTMLAIPISVGEARLAGEIARQLRSRDEMSLLRKAEHESIGGMPADPEGVE